MHGSELEDEDLNLGITKIMHVLVNHGILDQPWYLGF